MISAAEREFVLKLLHQAREELLRMMEGLSSEQLVYRSEPGRWSVADNVEHVVVVEKRLVGAIERLLNEPPDLVTQSVWNDQEVLRRIGTVVERAQAPESALPTSRWPAEQLLQEFETARKSTHDFASSTNGDLRHHFIRHPLFGYFDCYQFLLLIGAHSQRHTRQAESVVASPNFPRQNQTATRPA
jgi:uncharacterized damage-inducible protein DinB